MSIDELLDELDDMMDKAWGLPLSGGRCVVDVEKVREIIDDIRLNLPQEVRQAKAIVADRSDIIKTAKEEAEGIIRTAQEKARVMVSEEEVVKQAQEKAAQLLADTNAKTREMKKAAADFADNVMKATEENVGAALSDIRQARQALKAPSKL
jgi:cell division septum initiation protein DivIVA